MVKKLGLRSLFSKNKDTTSPPLSGFSSNPKNNSVSDGILICSNSTYIDSTDSCFTHSSNLTESESLSTSSEPSAIDHDESIIHAVKSHRLFFEPGSRSILHERRKNTQISEACGIEACAIAIEMESQDPYKDFINSMAEMVMANGIKDWDWLEKMLVWYLRVNPESAHGHIINAFVDLLMGFACNSDSCNCFSSSSSRFDFDEDENDCYLPCEISEVDETET